MVRSAPLVTSDKVVVVAGQDDCLYGVAPVGALAWKTQMPGQILGSPVADRNGHIYLGVSQAPRGMDPRGVLVCIDGNSHKVRWEYRTAAPVESTPAIGDDDVIYFGDNGGIIHAVNFSGKAEWTADVGSPVRSAGTFLATQSPGLRPGQRVVGGVGLFVRRLGRRRLAQGRPHARAERAGVTTDGRWTNDNIYDLVNRSISRGLTALDGPDRRHGH